MEEKIIYEVNITVGTYYKAHFCFDSAEEAGNFLTSAVKHNRKGERGVEISLRAKFEREEEEDEE